MFRYKPLTDQELNDISNPSLLPDGDYKFTIRYIEEQVSRSNNPMIKVTICVHSDIGQRNVVDYLLTTGKMAFKFKHFCNALSIPYESGQLDLLRLVNKAGLCTIGTQKGNLKDNGDSYPDKNVVIDYRVGIKVPVANKVNMDEDIPF